MNKTAAFIIGVLTGAAGGSAATYFIYKNIKDEECDMKISDMEEYFIERYEKKDKPKIEKKPEDKIDEVPTEDPREDEVVRNNEGVKKYHHENGLESAYGSARIFGSDAKPKKEKESKLINEISEQEFLNQENGYEKQTVDVFMSNDDDEPEIVGLWAYETDNEETVDKRFNKTINQLLNGRTYNELRTYCHDSDEEHDDGIGVLYLKNDEIKTDFEFVLHDNEDNND